jgi:hypothetical protein
MDHESRGMNKIVRNNLSLLMFVVLLGGSTWFASLVQAAQQTKPAPPPPRPAPRVAAPVAAKPGAPGGNKQGNNNKGTGTNAGGGAASGTAAKGSAAADPRSQLMDMLHPGGRAPAAKPLADVHRADVHPANVHAVPDRAAFARPAHIPHNPEHRVGRIGDRFHHAPFMFARGGHRFYRRYYLQDGHWFWYDEPAVVDHPTEDVSALPVCEANADDCQGNIVPLAASPDSGAATVDSGPAQ